MPVMDGFDTCASLRELPNGKNIPLLMVTGSEDADHIESAYLSGATDFVIKPVNWKVLIQRLRYMVKASRVLHRLEKSESRLARAQQMARLGHWEWTFANDALYWSDEIYQIFLIDKKNFKLSQQTFLERVNYADRLYVQECFNKVLNTSEPITIEYRIDTTKDRPRYINQQIEVTKNAQGKIIGLTGTIQDITERKENENQVRHLAYYDKVTGLPNRTYFFELLSNSLLLAKRNERILAVLFLDLDNFKGVNDSYGHHIGDQLLKEISRKLTEALRRSDVTSRYTSYLDYHADIARLGGDEFTILLNELVKPEDAAVAAQHLLDIICQPISLGEQKIYSRASIGIAVYPQDGLDIETLLKHADIAMYHAKTLGKGNFQFFHDSMNVKAKKRQEMEACMHQAVLNNELRLYYQPVVDTVSGQLTGVEALMRWESKELGFLMPNDFIPLAEENGMIIQFGEWALREVCGQHKLWQEQGMGHLTIAINLSGLQFNQASFLTTVRQIFADFQVDPAYFVLELTESILMADNEQVLSALWELKTMGFKLSIDDFGTGYSSLSYLKRFPLDILKIDHSFIKDLQANLDDRAIVQAIMALAKTLNLNTVAEGVETLQQKDFLESNLCDSMQGYFYSKPMPISEFHCYWQDHVNSSRTA
jgi:predicted signal transduction protein with EAL and GGDEF domain